MGAAACDRAAMATKNNEEQTAEEMNVGRMICGIILLLVMVEDADTTLEEPCKRCRFAALALPHADPHSGNLRSPHVAVRSYAHARQNTCLASSPHSSKQQQQHHH